MHVHVQVTGALSSCCLIICSAESYLQESDGQQQWMEVVVPGDECKALVAQQRQGLSPSSGLVGMMLSLSSRRGRRVPLLEGCTIVKWGDSYRRC